MINNSVKNRVIETQIERHELEKFAKEHCLVKDHNDLHPEVFPELSSLSPRFFYRFLPIPDNRQVVPEYVHLNRPEECGLSGDARAAYDVFVAEWNLAWEAGHLRREFRLREVPKELRWLSDIEADVRFVWRTRGHRYAGYSTLYHLLPRDTLAKFGLPLLRRGMWPQLMHDHLLEYILPEDFDDRLEKAFSYHMWPLLGTRGCPSAFSSQDPIRMLSHNLDYWMPYIDIVAQQRADALGRTQIDDAVQKADYDTLSDEVPDGVRVKTPLCGGPIWYGEADALEATRELIEIADDHGDLRAILEAVRSKRIEDDFSDRWSFEREDFERKLYCKRSKLKVTFVELDNTIPVHSLDAEVDRNLLWQDLFGLVDVKDKRIVVCLRSGVTKAGDIAKKLGYANHSSISRALARIRTKAKILLDIK